jgi:hypothetical protein
MIEQSRGDCDLMGRPLSFAASEMLPAKVVKSDPFLYDDTNYGTGPEHRRGLVWVNSPDQAAAVC